MLLALDIGNSEITVGLFRGDMLSAHWRLTTNPDRTSDEWGSAIGAFLLQAGHSPNEVRAVCLASVAPQVTQSLVGGLQVTTGIRPLTIDPRSELPITLDVDEPMSVGADRIVNALAGLALFRTDTVVVDFGTATTIASPPTAGLSGVPSCRGSGRPLTSWSVEQPSFPPPSWRRQSGRSDDERRIVFARGCYSALLIRWTG
jgi:pantothenate kinase type III